MLSIQQFTLPDSPDPKTDTYVSKIIDTTSSSNVSQQAIFQFTVGRGWIATLQMRMTGDLPGDGDFDFGWQDTLVYQPSWETPADEEDCSETYIDNIILAPEMRVKFQWTGHGNGIDYRTAYIQF